MISHLTVTYLLNALWQIPLIVGVAAICISLLKNIPARHRHFLWTMTLVLSFTLPLLSLNRMSQATNSATVTNPSEDYSVTATADEPDDGLLSIANLRNSPRPSVRLPLPLTAICASLYLLFLMYRVGRLWQSWQATIRIKRYSYPIVLPESITAIVNRCQTVLRLQGIPVLCRPQMSDPLTVGIWSPTIILPEYLIKDASTELLTAAVGHEMAHIRRRDFGFNILYEILYVPISFHPVAALVKRRIDETRELACDESVTEELMDKHSYARSLVSFVSSVAPRGRHAHTLGVTDANILEERVMKLLTGKTQISKRLTILSVTIASMILATVAVGAANFSLKITQQQQAAATTQNPASLFVGTWTGKRRPDDIADYSLRFSLKGSTLEGEALDVGRRQDVDKAGKKLEDPKKIRENWVKLQKVSLNGTTLSFALKDGKGRSQDATMKLINDNEALVEFVAEVRTPSGSDVKKSTETISVRLTKQP